MCIAWLRRLPCHATVPAGMIGRFRALGQSSQPARLMDEVLYVNRKEKGSGEQLCSFGVVSGWRLQPSIFHAARANAVFPNRHPRWHHGAVLVAR